MGIGGEQDTQPETLPAAFLSYSHRDDEDEGGTTRISELCHRLEQRVSRHIGLDFVIFQDRRALVWGENWRRRIDEALGGSTFLVVLHSPSFFGSEYCREETWAFLEREAEHGWEDRILVIRYDTVDPELLRSDVLAIALEKRHHVDWIDLQEQHIDSQIIRSKIIDCARQWHVRMIGDNDIHGVIQRARALPRDDGGLRVAQKWSERAAKQRDRGLPSDALKSLGHALEFGPVNTWLLTQRAIVYRAMTLFDAALADHDRAVKIDNTNAWVLRERAVTYRAMGQFADAVADHHTAVKLAPDDPDELLSRAETFEIAGRWAEAFTDRDRLLELRPSRAWSWADRGRCHRKLGHIDEALADYERALELAPENAWIRIGRAGVYWDAERHDEALVDYAYVLSEDPGNANALTRRVKLLRKMRRFAEARDDLDRAVDAKPEDSFILTQRAIFYRHLAEQGVNEINN